MRAAMAHGSGTPTVVGQAVITGANTLVVEECAPGLSAGDAQAHDASTSKPTRQRQARGCWLGFF